VPVSNASVETQTKERTMLMMNRRELMRTAGASAAALVLSPMTTFAADEAKADGFTLPKLPYEYDALEPYIDAETMKIHHDLHHQAYITNLNAALKGHPNLQKKSIIELLDGWRNIPENIRTVVRNNGGGHANHSMFWKIMTKGGGGKPDGELAKAIDESFESFDKFQALLSDRAVKQFGSGWAWLIVGKDKPLEVSSTPNQDSPLLLRKYPIMGIDVWEHAYYLKYQNRRPEYIEAWWNVINWDQVTENYAHAKK
jgi:Fe-Mn family superoxide dismutase